MYLNVEFPWNVVVPGEQLYGERLLIQRAIILQLLEDFSNCKATLDYGFFVAPPTVCECIVDGKVRQDSSNGLFPVVFNCITFKPLKWRDPVWCGKQDHETGGFPMPWSHYKDFPSTYIDGRLPLLPW
ncbi:hypothetical protein MKX03_037465, partial [Papaver bracteatum]